MQGLGDVHPNPLPGNWNPALNKYFQGREIVILPDEDSPGKRHAQMIASHLHSVAKSIKIIELSEIE